MKSTLYSLRKPIPWQQLLAEAIVLLCIALFVYAGLAKLLAYEKTTLQLARSPLFQGYAGFVSWSVPTMELIIAGLLAWHRTRLAGLYAFAGLMALFTAYIVYTLYFSGAVPCSCGGALEHLSWGEHLMFNAGFIALSVTGIALQHRIHKESTKRKEATSSE